MVSSKKGAATTTTTTTTGKSGLNVSRAGIVVQQEQEQLRGKGGEWNIKSGGCVDISAKLDICTATDPVKVFHVPPPQENGFNNLPLTIDRKWDKAEKCDDGGGDHSGGDSGRTSNQKLILKPFHVPVDGGCSRTTPIIWSPATSTSNPPIKQEQLCHTAASELSPKTSSGNGGMNFVNIKIEPKSPNCLSGSNQGTALAVGLDGGHRESLITSTMDVSNSQLGQQSSHYNTATGQIPVGIAVARQRLHPEPGLSGNGANGTMKDMHGSTRHLGSTFVEMIQSPQMGANMGSNFFLSGPPSAPAMIGPFTSDGVSVQNSALRAPSAIWQYPMTVEPMQMPLPPVGLQLVRDPTTGQYIFVPAMEPYPQTVVWPYANVQQTQPAPIQFLASDYLSASTTLHQHTQTSTRLVALANNNGDMKQRYMNSNSTGPTSGDSSGSLLSIMNKVPSMNSHSHSHLLPPTLGGNTIIKIEDNNCAISAGNSMSHEHAHHFNTGPAISTELLPSGFLMPHTPMLTPAPTMFDMSEKPFLGNIGQQQRQFQFNMNSSSMKSETGSGGDGSLQHHATDFNSLMFAQSSRVGDFQPTIDTSSLALAGHSTLMLTPDTVIASRSTGGLLTPPSPMPQKPPQVQVSVPSLLGSNNAASDTLLDAGGRLENNNSLLAICSMDSASENLGSSLASDRNCPSTGMMTTTTTATTTTVCSGPGVQDATMQTDTPVCSDEEENTQDTTISANGTREQSDDSESVSKLVIDVPQMSEEDEVRTTVCHNSSSASDVPGLASSSSSSGNGECERDSENRMVEQEVSVPVNDSEPKVRSEPVDLSGLELLSNSIEAFETIKRETGPVKGNTMEQGTSTSSEQIGDIVLTTLPVGIVSAPTPSEIAEPAPAIRVHNEQFDGLNLLCALAEQRLVEEGEEEQQKQKSVAGESSQGVAEVDNDDGCANSLRVATEARTNTSHIGFDEGPVEKLSDLERNIKQRLADLTRQCEEKRRELDKMEKINPFYRMGSYPQSSYPVPSKFVMSDDEETRSSRSASVRTPLTPTLLFGTNSNGQATSSGSLLVDAPKLSSDTESSKYDDSDLNSLEKMSKRKGGVPKRWDDCSETETIVAKKPKSLVGYIFSSKKNKNEQKSKGGASAPLIKHGQLKAHCHSNSPSSGSTSSEHIKFEPIKVKEEIIDEDVSQDADGSENNPFSFMSPRFTALSEASEMPAVDLFKASGKSGEERHSSSSSSKHRKRSKSKKHHHRDGEGKRKRSTTEPDNRCKLTGVHLDDKEKKTRVLTSMGGLFYAGVLSPIQPPDIYSVVLDGERGNRPHIMSREEVQRDAILEIVPQELSEVPPGTRLCAYWSQQYRCLYPGTAAQPGTPDVNSKKQYISVEFDDGDSGRIAMSDIRLLFRDYPIVEYDPNPLLSLGRRKGRASGPPPMAIQGTTTGSIFNTLNESVSNSNESPSRVDRAAEKERKRMKKMKRHLMKKQLVPCCQSSPAEDGAKKKDKCNEELCKHRKHKKKRKHKRQEREAAAAAAAAGQSEQQQQEVAELKESQGNVAADQEATDNKYKAAVDTEGTEETMDSYSAVDDPDFRDPSNKKKEQPSPEQNKSKIAAFLPARQLWAWAGESYRRSCVKGRVKKQFYKMIQRGKETIEIGDSAVFLSTGRADRPFIGRITSMWKTNSCNMIVRVKWFYHPEETQGCPTLKYPGGLFESPHEDENDVQTISHKCEVLGVYDFIKKVGDDPKNLSLIYDNNDTYYLAGNYDPTAISLSMQPNIPTIGAAVAAVAKESG